MSILYCSMPCAWAWWAEYSGKRRQLKGTRTRAAGNYTRKEREWWNNAILHEVDLSEVYQWASALCSPSRDPMTVSLAQELSSGRHVYSPSSARTMLPTFTPCANERVYLLPLMMIATPSLKKRAPSTVSLEEESTMHWRSAIPPISTKSSVGDTLVRCGHCAAGLWTKELNSSSTKQKAAATISIRHSRQVFG